MKLSVTTLGCPDWDMPTLIESLREYGFDSVDFRGYKGEMEIYKLAEFSSGAEETHKRIAAAGLEVSCFSSSVKLISQDLASSIAEVREYARLCKLFGTRYIRVFGGSLEGMDRAQAVETVVGNLQPLAAVAKSHGVKLLLETHDDWTDCKHVKAVMEQVDTEAVGVLWDVHHPYRMIGEKPAHTWEMIGQWVAYTHWKDSRLKPEGTGDFEYCLTGEGNIPLRDIYHLLRNKGYQGYFTLEWEKKWHPQIAEPEAAFPQYVQYMRRLQLND